MAENFRNARAVILNTNTDIYTVPAATKAIVIGCQVANVKNDGPVGLTIWWTDASASNAVTRLGEIIVVPEAAAYEPIGGKLVLEAGDKIIAKSSSSTDLEATLSVLELS